jgi:hypothetical protein
MKQIIFLAVFMYGSFTSQDVTAQPKQPAKTATAAKKETKYYIDIHYLGAGKVTAKDVAAAHSKDLAVEKKYGVRFLKYWLDELRGDVYCLSSSTGPSQINKTHAAAHGLLPDEIFTVTAGVPSVEDASKSFYLDMHELIPGKVTASDVEAAHKKDLALQHRHGVNFLNYWVDEKRGTVLCLSQASDSSAVIKTHEQAHGLLPLWVRKVVQGQ